VCSAPESLAGLRGHLILLLAGSRVYSLSLIILECEIFSCQDKMSSPTALQKRKDLIKRVGMELGREIGTVSIFFHQAIASQLGLNVTDTRCFELLSRYSKESPTAGDLARDTGLTTGAITGILDRLENAGLVQRFRDPADRRKVFIRPRAEALRRFGHFYQGLGSAMIKLASSYPTKDLAVICDYMEHTLKVFREQSKKL
jgi:DNA-binding MarR family transcriptional regulator